MSDQDTTAPTVTIHRVEVAAQSSDPIAKVMRGWWHMWLASNIADAALEEMRVRAAVVRAMQDPFCFLCGGLLTAKGDCVTHGCASERINTAMEKGGDA